MGRGYRPQRLGEEIRKIISDLLIRGELKDPGFRGLVGVSAVDVTRDGSYATVFVTTTGLEQSASATPEEKQVVLDAFQRSKGFIRTEVARLVRMRHVPELLFQFDDSLEYGRKMDEILSGLVSGEEERVEESEEE